MIRCTNAGRGAMGRRGVRRHETGTARSRHGLAWVRRQGTETARSHGWVQLSVGVGAPGPAVEPAVAHKVRKRHAAVGRKPTTRAASMVPGMRRGWLPPSFFRAWRSSKKGWGLLGCQAIQAPTLILTLTLTLTLILTLTLTLASRACWAARPYRPQPSF